ncbi:sulfite exporter TauE/SafE family protein [Segeticoccus rhizosphaerae]|uniref:sulfite exporter TauE/SafE family protein n=1 Tax=Segeticoccus rhizosphaerae TaxID=1104777 RepID=UPI0010C02F91|nr:MULTISPECIES: sulfite exporter TauE/SafE family protein [Intrasporangiaceae]
MSLLEALAILLAGMAAGTINVIVGSGTLITFPTLLFFGYPAVAANMSNSVGLVAGGFSGVYGYRAELRGQGHVLRQLVPASLAGGVTGALLLLGLPPDAFQAIVPVLIAIAALLVVLGPAIQRRSSAAHPDRQTPTRRWLLIGGVYLAGAYGGYFGAAQGVLLVGLMNVLMSAGLQRINGIKNVLSTVVNLVAAVTFMIVAWDQIRWEVAALIAVGSLIGGYVGARIGRKMPPWLLRSVIVLISVVAITKIVFFD